MELPIFYFPRLTRCPDHWLYLMPSAKNYGEICKKCRWKSLPTGGILRPVKFFNRYWDH